MISPFQVSASGSIQQSAVDMTTVEALIHATDNLMIYLGLATFFSGTAISLALTLFADIDHPIPVYLALTAALSLTVAMVFVLSREFSRVRSLRTALRTSAGNSELHYYTSDWRPSCLKRAEHHGKRRRRFTASRGRCVQA